MKKRLLIRFYSAYNLGDDLFLSIVAARYGTDSITVAGRKVPLHLKAVKRLSNLTYAVFRIVEKLLGRNVINAWLAKKADMLLYVGGSIFIEGANLEKWRRERSFYANLKIPYYILGSNFGPYKNPEFIDIAKDIIAGAKDVCFRDKASYDMFSTLKPARLSTDVAFTLDTSRYTKKTEELAIFSLIDGGRKFNPSITRKYEDEVINLTRRLVEEGYKVTYMSFCSAEGDEIAAKRILNQLDASTRSCVSMYNYKGNLEESLDLLAKSELIVATRFHAAILGLIFNKKVLPMAYSAKTINILQDMNFQGPVVDISKISEFNGSDFDFNSLQVNNVSEQIKLAELQFQELDKVLAKK